MRTSPLYCRIIALQDDRLGPRTSEYAVHDFDQPGLFVRVRPSGNRTYYYRPHGGSNQRAVRLGNAEQLTVSDARLKSRRIDDQLANGGRISELSSKAAAGTVRKAWVAFRPRAGSEWANRIERVFTSSVLPIVGDVKLANLTYSQLDRIISESPTYYGRRNLRVVISGFLSWCVSTRRVDTNVLKGGRRDRRPKPRKRRLFDGPELRVIWDACEVLPDRWRDVFRLVIASGLPVREVLRLPANVLTFWRDGAELFGPLATELIQGMRPMGIGWLFSAPGKTRPMAFQQGMLKRLCGVADLGPFTTGDLQRSSVAVSPMRGGSGFEWKDFLPPVVPESDPAEAVDL